jgi:hypothetical protein
MLLDHQHNVASEMQTTWRAEAHHERTVTGGRTVTAGGEHRLHLRQSVSAFMHAHHPHVPMALHASSHGH